jgi:hypothetical protein
LTFAALAALTMAASRHDCANVCLLYIVKQQEAQIAKQASPHSTLPNLYHIIPHDDRTDKGG